MPSYLLFDIATGIIRQYGEESRAYHRELRASGEPSATFDEVAEKFHTITKASVLNFSPHALTNLIMSAPEDVDFYDLTSDDMDTESVGLRHLRQSALEVLEHEILTRLDEE